MRLSFVAPLSFLLLGAVCAGSGASLTESGRGKPEVQVSFPARTSPASVETAVVDVTNPGPGDIDSLFVAFSLVGVGGVDGVAEPLVETGARGHSPSIVNVRPPPEATSRDGVIYRFSDPTGRRPILAVGDSVQVEFDLRAPHELGRAASSLQVYAGEDPARSQGTLLETEVAADG
jgi:hypothetical protein